MPEIQLDRFTVMFAMLFPGTGQQIQKHIFLIPQPVFLTLETPAMFPVTAVEHGFGYRCLLLSINQIIDTYSENVPISNTFFPLLLH